MEIEQLKLELKQLLDEVSADNFSLYRDKFADAIKQYKESGGKGKLVEEYISQLSKELKEPNDYKEEVLEDSSCRIVGLCSPHLRILFDDFDESMGKWK